jgi:membrane fusion protein (multidrug efflux system)
VNGYVTFVAPRVSGQVARVLVDDNNRVKTGDVLVELDPEPYQVQVAIKQAAVDTAQANLVVAEASVQGLVGQLRSQRFKLTRAIEDVDNQIALIRARVATWEQSKATLVLAQAEFDRAEHLLATKVVSAEEYDQRRETLDVGKAQVTQALENVLQARVALGQPAQPPAGTSLADVPADLDQTFSSVRQAQADLIQSAAQLGVVQSTYNLTPKQTLDEFYRRDPSGDLDRIFAAVMKNAPSLKQAETNLLQAQRDLDKAKLDLRYCTVVAEIDGAVTRRNVNPGNNVQIGQSLMAIRSLRDIWIDANFKETQLRDLRIGQRVDLETDMYGGKREFEGRISGFTMGTGSTLALLPAQNATGNFVKVVQRLPVRIDVMNYDPDKLPLFVGLSVTPTVDLKNAPSGPNAGKFLQEPSNRTSATSTP